MCGRVYLDMRWSSRGTAVGTTLRLLFASLVSLACERASRYDVINVSRMLVHLYMLIHEASHPVLGLLVSCPRAGGMMRVM